MSDRPAAEPTDQVVRLALEAVERRLKEIRDEVTRLSDESDRRQQEFTRLSGELGRWMTAKSGAEASMTSRIDGLEKTIKRLQEFSGRS